LLLSVSWFGQAVLSSSQYVGTAVLAEDPGRLVHGVISRSNEATLAAVFDTDLARAEAITRDFPQGVPV
jgi:hypothetical protein